MMEELPSNSFKSKEEKKVVADGKRKQITTAKVLQKKKSFAETFFGDSTRAVGSYILFDVLIPAIKSTLSDIVSNGIEMLLYGEPQRSKRDKRTSHVSYGSYYNRDRNPRQESRVRPKHRFDDLVIDSRGEEEEVLENLMEVLDQYGVVSVAEFYDLVGFTGDWSDNKYGWDNLSRATILRTRDGYILDLPKPLPID